MSELNHLNRLLEDRIKVASRVVARAFQNDPLFVYLYPKPLDRQNKYILMFEN